MSFLLTQSDEETIELAWSIGLTKAAIGFGDGYCQISGNKIIRNTGVTLYVFTDDLSLKRNNKNTALPYLFSQESYIMLKTCLDYLYPRRRK